MHILEHRQHKPVSILLVEDDDGDARAIERAFYKARVANPIVRAIDGVEALDLIRSSNGRAAIKAPYLLLVDLNMPRMDGLELIDRIRKDPDLERLIIFVLTTSKRDEDMAAAYEQHIAGYITKEKAGDDFLNLLELLDCYWRIVEIPEV